MTSPKYIEQYERCERYLRELLSYRDKGFPHVSPVDMTPDQLSVYGLTEADRERFLAWSGSIPEGSTSLDPAPVADILVNWLKAGIDPPEILDAVYTFFQHCYHLKDWIKNDPTSGLGGSVEAFISGSPNMSLCADICNGSKHLTLTNSRSGDSPSVHGTGQAQILGGVVTVQTASILHNGNNINSFDLAEQCMCEWRNFLGI